MSKKGDFLSGFSGGTTQKPLTEQPPSPVKETNPTEVKKTDVKKDLPTKTNVAENKKLADKIVADTEKKSNTSPLKGNASPRPASPEASPRPASRPAQSASAIIKAPEHVVTRDEQFHKRKLIKYGIIGTASVVVVALGALLFIMLNRVEVPNFVGQELREAQNWSVLDGSSLSIEEEYSLEFAEGIIKAQDREPRTMMSSNSTLGITVSKGPNMDEIVALPDFEEMTRAQITTWQREKQVNGINVRDEHNATVEPNYFIRLEAPSTVDLDNFRRRDTLTIFVSSGPETITIGRMIGNNREQVDKFIEENPGIKVELEFEGHETIARGTVLAQSHAPNTRLPMGETFTLTLSAGDPVIVPDFSTLSKPEAEALQQAGELNLQIIDRFHPTILYGRFVSQSIEAGEELFGDTPSDLPLITVVYSLNRPWMEMLSSEREIQIRMRELINNGATGLTWRVNRIDHWRERGAIVDQSRHGQFIALDDHIEFYVSLGNLDEPTPPGGDSGLPPGGDGGLPPGGDGEGEDE